MQTEIKISDVLHLAADKYLAKNFNESANWGQKHRYSCCAVEEALDVLQCSLNMHRRVFAGLEAMGCKSSSFDSFANLEGGFNMGTPKSQAARYFWLKWAALMAEEQGE